MVPAEQLAMSEPRACAYMWYTPCSCLGKHDMHTCGAHGPKSLVYTPCLCMWPACIHDMRQTSGRHMRHAWSRQDTYDTPQRHVCTWQTGAPDPLGAPALEEGGKGAGEELQMPGQQWGHRL